jgi:hypothetical protein
LQPPSRLPTANVVTAETAPKPPILPTAIRSRLCEWSTTVPLITILFEKCGITVSDNDSKFVRHEREVVLRLYFLPSLLAFFFSLVLPFFPSPLRPFVPPVALLSHIIFALVRAPLPSSVPSLSSHFQETETRHANEGID